MNQDLSRDDLQAVLGVRKEMGAEIEPALVDSLAAKVEAIARKYSRPVLLTETGFSSYQAPHREPWSEAPRKLAPQDQARCYEAIYKAFYGKPWLAGIYWWKVGTNGYGGPDDGSHTPWGKPAMEVVRKYYRSGRR